MDFIRRHANMTVFLVVMILQVVGLAVQVKRPGERGPTRLVRIWGVSLVAPLEEAVEHGQGWMAHLWRDYFYLRDVRRENDRLQEEILRLRLEQVRLAEDADQAHRLQALMKFRESFIAETVVAQVIGSSGSESSRILYIDKGARDGLKSDMAVLTPAGIVGKLIFVAPKYSQVLEINDPSSGVGAMLEKSRLQGILKGSPSGETMVHYIMGDEHVQVGEMVLTSGGDRVFPKGLPIGHVAQLGQGPDTFLRIKVKPLARLSSVEEVLVITKLDEKEPQLLPEAPMRAADILAQRLPTVPVRPPDPNASPSPTPGGSPVPVAAHASASPSPAPANKGAAAGGAANAASKSVPGAPTEARGSGMPLRPGASSTPSPTPRNGGAAPSGRGTPSLGPRAVASPASGAAAANDNTKVKPQ